VCNGWIGRVLIYNQVMVVRFIQPPLDSCDDFSFRGPAVLEFIIYFMRKFFSAQKLDEISEPFCLGRDIDSPLELCGDPGLAVSLRSYQDACVVDFYGDVCGLIVSGGYPPKYKKVVSTDILKVLLQLFWIYKIHENNITIYEYFG